MVDFSSWCYYSAKSKTKYISEEYTIPDHLVLLEEGNLGVDGMDGVCSFLQVVAGRWLVATSSGGWWHFRDQWTGGRHGDEGVALRLSSQTDLGPSLLVVCWTSSLVLR